MIVRNLPVSETYRLVRSFHTGGVENAQCCANCRRAIVEVAVVVDTQGNEHAIGMDCAETLTSIASDFTFRNDHKGAFTDAKAFASLLRKARKNNPSGLLTTFHYAEGTGYYKQGGFLIDFGTVGSPGHFSKNYPAHLIPYIGPIAASAIKARPAAMLLGADKVAQIGSCEPGSAREAIVPLR